MVSTSEKSDYSVRLRVLGIGVIWGTGVVLGAVELRHVVEMSGVVGVVGFALLPFLANVGVIAAGYHLWRSGFDGGDVARIAVWVLFGTIVLALLATWTITHQNVMGEPFAHGIFVVVNNMSAGALVGFGIGWYDVRSRHHQRDLERERSKLAFLNRLVRHDILNAVQVVEGRGSLLEEAVTPDAREHLTAVLNRTAEIRRFIDSIGVITRHPTTAVEHLEPRSLTSVLDEQVAAATNRYDRLGEVSIDVDGNALVLADGALDVVFENVLATAVNSSGRPDIDLAITTRTERDRVVVSLAGNGGEITDVELADVGQWRTSAGDRSGTSIGLALADMLLDRYDGDFWFEQDDDGATVLNVAIPRASG